MHGWPKSLGTCGNVSLPRHSSVETVSEDSRFRVREKERERQRDFSNVLLITLWDVKENPPNGYEENLPFCAVKNARFI